MGPLTNPNARQVELLRRIAHDIEPVTSREPVIALSVYALRSRGLVTTSWADGIWVATVTDAGLFYLQHGTYPVDAARPAAERKSKPAMSRDDVGTASSATTLVARVQAAGGTLVLSDLDEATRAALRGAIQNAINAGHRLHYTGRLRGDLVITMASSHARNRASPTDHRGGPRSTTPGRQTARGPLHPLVADLRTAATTAACHAAPDPRLPPVSRAALQRALKVLHLLFSQAEERGHAVHTAHPAARHRPCCFQIVVHGHEYPVTITEYNGILTLKLDGVFSGRRTWGDGVRVRLEEKLGDILSCLEQRADQAEQRRRERERLAHEHALAKEVQTARCRTAYIHDFATDALREQTAAWRLADEIRALCDRMQQRISNGTAPADNRFWVVWALEHAERLDPTTRCVPVPCIPEPTAQDLARYLDTPPNLTSETRP